MKSSLIGLSSFLILMSTAVTAHARWITSVDLSAQEQILLAQYAFNMATKERAELKTAPGYVINRIDFKSAEYHMHEILDSVVVPQQGISQNFKTSGVDRTSRQDVRLTSWNLESQSNITEVKQLLSVRNLAACAAASTDLQKERCALADSDILVLTGADKGVCRSGNQDLPSDVGQASAMNVAFGPEFFEAEPGLHGLHSENTCMASMGTDHSNLSGNAILSRFPIAAARNIRLPVGYLTKEGKPATKEHHDTFCWNWLSDEAREPTLIDKSIQAVAGSTFNGDGTSRHLRFGSRAALAADIQLPNRDILTVVAVNLESKAQPSCRRAQMAYILNEMKNNRHPIVYAGDFNTSGHNGGRHSTAKTSASLAVGQTVMSPTFYSTLGLYTAPLGVGAGAGAARAAFTFLTTHRNPTRKNIFWFRHNGEGPLFNMLKENGILWQGDHGPWSATNERAKMGFKGTSYAPNSRWIFGESKLDWIFFKPARGQARLTPKYPRTLEALRAEMGERFPSHHLPITVLLEVNRH